MEMSIKIHPDEEGYIGRECLKCEKYFKVKSGTGLRDATDCHCPYCNYTGPQNQFWTKQQLEYAKSVAMNKITGDLLKELKKMERRPNRNAFMSIGITVKGQPSPIAFYTEQELEQKLVCSECTLHYSIYGVFGYCPDCGVHNSAQIVNVNFDLILRVLDLASTAPGDVKVTLVENALEDAVSAFDGFGRERCSQIGNLSFQNIATAKDRILRDHGIDISDGLDAKQWSFVCEQFQKRHLLAHKMGVIDNEFINKTGCSPALLGRRVVITEGDVGELIKYLRQIAQTLTSQIKRS